MNFLLLLLNLINKAHLIQPAFSFVAGCMANLTLTFLIILNACFACIFSWRRLFALRKFLFFGFTIDSY